MQAHTEYSTCILAHLFGEVKEVGRLKSRRIKAKPTSVGLNSGDEGRLRYGVARFQSPANSRGALK
ncbi:MAG: hypothetical protein AB1817_07065 [Chloroflexota bacterium]